MRRLTAYLLERVGYAEGLAIQKQLADACRSEAIGDSLLLLEHPPVLTLGRKATTSNVLASPNELAQLGIELFHTDRGGDVTYHGPGQIVGYPILNLAPDRKDVRRYVRDVEEAIIRALARFGISAVREPRWPGVWVSGSDGLAKIAAIGVHLSRWITRHGFALNVNTNMSHFKLIVPCGIHEAGVTSMQRVLSRSISLDEVKKAVAESFADVFGASLKLTQELPFGVSVRK